MRTLATFGLFATLLAGAAAHATPFVGQATFVDETSGNQLNVTASPNPVPINLNLPLYGSQYFSDFTTLTFSDTSLTALQTDQVALQFSFTQPGNDGGSTNGTADDQGYYFFVHLNAGGIAWSGDTHFDLQNLDFYSEEIVPFAGAPALGIDVYDAAFLVGSSNQQVDLAVRFTDVPEPASLAIIGTGLIGLGALRRRQAVRKEVVAAIA